MTKQFTPLCNHPQLSPLLYIVDIVTFLFAVQLDTPVRPAATPHATMALAA